jgi:hypothetical protein
VIEAEEEGQGQPYNGSDPSIGSSEPSHGSCLALEMPSSYPLAGLPCHLRTSSRHRLDEHCVEIEIEPMRFHLSSVTMSSLPSEAAQAKGELPL